MFENCRSKLQHLGIDVEQKIARKRGRAMGWTNNSGPREVQLQQAVAEEATRQGLGKIRVKRFDLIIGKSVHPNATKVKDSRNTHLSEYWNAVKATRKLMGGWGSREDLTEDKLSEAATEGVKTGYKNKLR